jgi:predicted GH43/DUF377 family glycosyl hydrolase
MQHIYDEVKTPYKYGVVIKGIDPDELVDSPSIFRSGGRWYMMFVASVKNTGYQTWLARSDDLLTWERLGKVLSFSQPGNWDAWQADGGVSLCDYTWGGSAELEKYGGKYWMSYIGGAEQGYEPDPLSIGMATSICPTEAKEWLRYEHNPVLGPHQPDVRAFEQQTLYRSQIIRDQTNSLGWPFVMFYNGKIKGGYEKIGMAVSNDMLHWTRYGHEPVISNGDDKQYGISGDPQIVRIGDVWVMFYFGASWRPKAFDTFACSYDLVNWAKWDGPNLIDPSEPFDEQYAHKPWLVKWNGVVYHFYCAVGNQGRVLALATSKELR